MKKNITILNKEEHIKLTFTPPKDFGFARHLQLIPISFREIKFLCCRYPVVIAELDGKLALVIAVSLEDDHNIAIDESGKFRGNYLPAYLQKYPFMLIKDEKQNKIHLGFDEDIECFKQDKGERLYDDEGNPTELVDNIAKFLANYEKDIQLTNITLNKFKELDILEDSKILFGDEDSKKAIGGFSVVNKEKLLKQNDEVLVNAMKNSWTELIELHHLSLNNFSILKV